MDSRDPGGIYVGAKLYRTCDTNDHYTARFEPLGEHLIITDSYADGRSAKVYFEVEGNGTAIYTEGGDHNLSFDEGLDVRLKVCINGTSTCTAWSPKGRT